MRCPPAPLFFQIRFVVFPLFLIFFFFSNSVRSLLSRRCRIVGYTFFFPPSIPPPYVGFGRLLHRAFCPPLWEWGPFLSFRHLFFLLMRLCTFPLPLQKYGRPSLYSILLPFPRLVVSPPPPFVMPNIFCVRALNDHVLARHRSRGQQIELPARSPPPQVGWSFFAAVFFLFQLVSTPPHNGSLYFSPIPVREK